MKINPEYLNRYYNNNKSFSSRNETTIMAQKILIVDENPIIAQSTKRIFQIIFEENNIDLEVIACYDGFDMIRVYLNEEVTGLSNLKFIIVDENMEYLNGSEGIKFIRIFEKRKDLKKTKIFSVCSNLDEYMSEKIYQAGADKLLYKPLTRLSVQNLLKDYGFIK